MANPAKETTSYPFTAFRFSVTISVPDFSNDPLCNAAFAECDGLETNMDVKTIREGGNNAAQIRLFGAVNYGTLTLKRGMTSNLDLWKWFSLATGNTARGTMASGTILMRNGDGRNTVRFKLTDCLPLKIKAPALNAKDGILAIEEMQIAYSLFTVELA